jgi:hypothetical protein
VWFKALSADAMFEYLFTAFPTIIDTTAKVPERTERYSMLIEMNQLTHGVVSRCPKNHIHEYCEENKDKILSKGKDVKALKFASIPGKNAM